MNEQRVIQAWQCVWPSGQYLGMPGCSLSHPPSMGQQKTLRPSWNRLKALQVAGITQGKSLLSSWHLSFPKHFGDQFRTPVNRG